MLKSKIGHQSNRENFARESIQPVDETFNMSERNDQLPPKSRKGRNSMNQRAFQTLQDRTAPLVGPSPKQLEQLELQTLTSPGGVFSSEGEETVTTTTLKPHEKRVLIDKFLKDEHVFQLLYETVFASQNERV